MLKLNDNYLSEIYYQYLSLLVPLPYHKTGTHTNLVNIGLQLGNVLKIMGCLISSKGSFNPDFGDLPLLLQEGLDWLILVIYLRLDITKNQGAQAFQGDQELKKHTLRNLVSNQIQCLQVFQLPQHH